MQLSIPEIVFQTNLFIGLFILASCWYRRQGSEESFFSKKVSQELKGVAILAIVFAHVGLFLAKDQRFLSPLSLYAGVGVDTFLFLSGFGLAISAFKNTLPPFKFYLHRLSRLFVPLWLVLLAFLPLDYWLLGIRYSREFLWHCWIGYFPSGDIFHDFNSPLWYFTFILIFYFFFPWLFSRRWAYWSAAALAVIGYLAYRLPWPINDDVQHLYGLHFLAFPLGICWAATLVNYPILVEKIKKIKEQNLYRWLILIFLLLGLFWLNKQGAVGKGIWSEQIFSLLITLLVVLFFSFKKIASQSWEIVGKYSYEIYLLHWPIYWRYQILYQYLPAWLATAAYLLLIFVLAVVLHKLAKWLINQAKLTLFPIAN